VHTRSILSLQSPRRASLDGYNSPPVNGGYFPHDLDDIYEYKTDHQYFTYTGGYRTANKPQPPLTSDQQRNQLFRNSATQSLDNDKPKNRFDNSSFIKSLSSNSSSGSADKEGGTKVKGHHHNSIQEMIKSFGRKVHIWPRQRHESVSECTSDSNPLNDPQENFRLRSKSLDVQRPRSVLDDCEETYKIFNKIVKEGDF
jgi:5'-AMP-activated protein kinase, regulatory gamma subunit